MSEFEPFGNEVQIGRESLLPPKDIADKYIEGGLFI